MWYSYCTDFPRREQVELRIFRKRDKLYRNTASGRPLMLYLGCHLSSSKGYAAMGRTALSIGANTFQFFTRNPRGGAAKSADPADAAALVQMQRDGRLGRARGPCAVYAEPLLQGRADARVCPRGLSQSDLQRMELTPGNFYNFHPGSHVGQGVEAGNRPDRRVSGRGRPPGAAHDRSARNDVRQGKRGRRPVRGAARDS